MAKKVIIETKKHLNNTVRYGGIYIWQEIAGILLLMVLVAARWGITSALIGIIPIIVLGRIKKGFQKERKDDIYRDLLALVTYRKSFEDRSHLFKYLLKNNEH